MWKMRVPLEEATMNAFGLNDEFGDLKVDRLLESSETRAHALCEE